MVVAPAHFPPLELGPQHGDLAEVVLAVYLLRNAAVGMLHGQFLLLLQSLLLQVNLLDLILLLVYVVQLRVRISVQLVRVSVVTLLVDRGHIVVVALV